MIVQKDKGITMFHDEHDFEITVSNDNTKQTKVCKIKIRGDIFTDDTLKFALDKAKELYDEALK